MRKVWAVLVLAIGMLCGASLLSGEVSAIANTSALDKLANAQAVLKCYKAYAKSNFGVANFNSSSNKLSVVFKTGFTSGWNTNEVYVPTGFGDSDGKTNCKKVMSNYTLPASALDYGYKQDGNKFVADGNSVDARAAVLVKNLTGGGDLGAGHAQTYNSGKGVLYTWDNKSKYALYMRYIENYGRSGFIKAGECSSTKPSGYAYKKSSGEWCALVINNSADSTITISVPTADNKGMKSGKLSTALNFLSNQANYNGFGSGDYAQASLTAAEGTEDDQTGTKSNSELCYSAGIVSQSWVLCPAIDNMEVSASAIDNLIGDWLSVDTNLYDSDSATYTVWEIMRNIANIAMVLVLLAVIVSQLTGWGIDNYGIKKILPRLVAMAIVVNLSFVACQLVIDISNILGQSLNTMFRSIGAGIPLPEGASMENFIGTAVTGIFAAAGLTGAALPMAVTVVGAASSMGPMAVILIALALITVVVAVLLFFVMLGTRMVLVILCTAVAPVVAVLYILPNTQRWAKNWWKLFQALLVMYPICGAVAGVSYLIKAVVLSMNGAHLWMLVVGIIGPFLPFFMLPSLLKNAISMLGSVGAAMVSAGRGLRHGLALGTTAIQGTAMAQNQMALGRQNLNRKLAGMDANGYLTARGKRLAARARNNPRAARLMSMRIGQAKKDNAEMEEANAALAGVVAASGIPKSEDFGAVLDHDGATKPLFTAGTAGAYYAQQFAAAAETGDTTGMNAALIAARNGGVKAKDIARIVRYQVNKKNGINLNDNVKAEWMRNLASSQDGAFLSKDFELKHYMQNGGATNEGRLGGYGEYALNAPINPDDMNPDDIAALSGDSMAAMIAAGKITAGMAQSVLASNPNISEDKRIMLGAMAAGKMKTNDPNLGPVEAWDLAAAKIKQEAKDIMRDKNANAYWIGGDASERESWTKSTPQRVEIVGGGQLQSQPGGVNAATNGIDDVNAQLRQQNRAPVDVPRQSTQPSQGQAGSRIITNASGSDFQAARNIDRNNNPGSTMYGNN